MKTFPMLERRRTQREQGLPQQQGPRQLGRHEHGFWEYTQLPLYAAYESINSVTYVNRGIHTTIKPWTLLYAVSCNFHFTYTFAGNPESFTIKLTLGDETQEITTDTNATYSTVTTNVSDLTERMYKDMEETDLYFQIKVSNVANPVELFGVYLEFNSYMKDNYGDYKSPIYPLYDEKLAIYNKAGLGEQEKRMEDESYLSGLAKS